MMHTVGVVGLGNMGAVLAQRLGKRFQVIGYDIDPKRRESMSGNGIVCKESLEDLAGLVDVVILSLPKPEFSFQVVQKMAPLLRPGATVVETSTVAPEDVAQLSQVCSPYEVNVVDAALLGGVSHALEGTIGLLLGGSPEDIQRIQGVFDEISNDAQRVGTLGAGMAAKIINNAVAHSVMVLIVEAAALGVKNGLTTDAIYKLLSGETALQRPLTHRFKERILKDHYEGGMSTSNARKDSTLALSLAQKAGVPLFAIQSTHSVYEMAVQEGLGNLDYASIAKLWESWNKIQFAN